LIDSRSFHESSETVYFTFPVAPVTITPPAIGGLGALVSEILVPKVNPSKEAVWVSQGKKRFAQFRQQSLNFEIVKAPGRREWRGMIRTRDVMND
jgi:hypothetical protein